MFYNRMCNCNIVVSGDRKITDYIGFSVIFVGIRYFSVFKIPKSVSVSVFKNIEYRFGFSVNRPISTFTWCSRDIRLIPPTYEYERASSPVNNSGTFINVNQ